MAEFEIAAAFVLANEGGYEPASAADPGGETRYGISKRAYPDEDIRNLTLDRAKQIYRKDFWRFDGVKDQSVANKLLDLVVNLGMGGGVRLAQRALGAFLAGPIVQDGVFGSGMTAFVNECEADKFLLELRHRTAQQYCQDLQKNPAELPLALGLFRRAAR